MGETKYGYDYVRRKIKMGLSGRLQWKSAVLAHVDAHREREKDIKSIYDVYERHILYGLPIDRQGIITPSWLRPIIDHMHSLTNGDELCFSVPVQHGKTSLIFAFFAYISQQEQWKNTNWFYITYSQTQAQDVQTRFCSWLNHCGIQYTSKKYNVFLKHDKWRLKISFGSLGLFTGQPCTGGAVVDDPVKAADATFSTRHDKIYYQFNTDVATRVQGPKIVVHTRWAIEDLIGRLVDDGWKYINIPCIAESVDDPLGREHGEYLWPERWNADTTHQAQNDELAWAALYQGTPVDRLNALIPNVQYYADEVVLNIENPIITYGLDLAYGGRDWSVMARMYTCRKTKRSYVVDVIRSQRPYTEYIQQFTAFYNAEPGRIRFDYGGQERTISDIDLRKKMPNIIAVHATGGKPQIRYTKAISAIRQGTIMFNNTSCIDHVKALTAVDPDPNNHRGTDDLQAVSCAWELAQQSLKSQQTRPQYTSQNNTRWTGARDVYNRRV